MWDEEEIYVYMHIYIYIYIFTERRRTGAMWDARTAGSAKGPRTN